MTISWNVSFLPWHSWEMSKYELLPQVRCVWFSQHVKRWYRTLSVYWRVLWQFWVLSAKTRAIRTSTNISLRVYPRSSGGFSCQKLSKPETNVFLKGLPLQETHKHYLVSSKPCLDQLWQCCNRTLNVSMLSCISHQQQLTTLKQSFCALRDPNPCTNARVTRLEHT